MRVCLIYWSNEVFVAFNMIDYGQVKHDAVEAIRRGASCDGQLSFQFPAILANKYCCCFCNQTSCNLLHIGVTTQIRMIAHHLLVGTQEHASTNSTRLRASVCQASPELSVNSVSICSVIALCIRCIRLLS